MHFINNQFILKYVLPSDSAIEDIFVQPDNGYDEFYIADLDSTTFKALTDYRKRIMTSLAYQIGSLLLPICLEETRKMREIYKPVDKAPLPPQVTALELILRRAGGELKCDAKTLEWQRDLFAALVPEHSEVIKSLKLPHEITNILPIYNPFTVIVLHSKQSGNSLLLNIPRIVTHGKHRFTVHLDDEPQESYNHATTIDQTRVATDEEVENCVMSLTPKQLRSIMSHELFAPIVNQLYEEQTELVSAEEVVTKAVDKEVEEDDVPWDTSLPFPTNVNAPIKSDIEYLGDSKTQTPTGPFSQPMYPPNAYKPAQELETLIESIKKKFGDTSISFDP